MSRVHVQNQRLDAMLRALLLHKQHDRPCLHQQQKEQWGRGVQRPPVKFLRQQVSQPKRSVGSHSGLNSLNPSNQSIFGRRTDVRIPNDVPACFIVGTTQGIRDFELSLASGKGEVTIPFCPLVSGAGGQAMLDFPSSSDCACFVLSGSIS